MIFLLLIVIISFNFTHWINHVSEIRADYQKKPACLKKKIHKNIVKHAKTEVNTTAAPASLKSLSICWAIVNDETAHGDAKVR